MGRDATAAPRRWLGPVLVPVAAFAAALLGIALTRAAGNVASLWVANAVLIAALVMHPRREWPALVALFVAGNAGANLAAGDTAWVSLGFGLVNAAEAVAATLLLRRLLPASPNFESVRDLFAFAACAGLAAPLLGATLGAWHVAAAFGAPYGAVWPTWAMGDSLGNLSMAPLLILIVQAWRRRASLGRGELLEIAGASLLMVATCLVVFGQTRYTIAFLIVPPAIVATHRAGPLGATLSAAVVALVGGAATAYDLGPMSLVRGGMDEQVRIFQLLLLTLLVCTMPLAAVLAERRSLEAQLRAAALRDELTGLTNRAGLMAHLASALASPARPSLLVIDVDHFKAVNDRHGHLVGDQVLEAVAQGMRRALRSDDLLARLGGEEFVVVLPDTPLAVASRVGERLRRAVEGRAGDGVWLPAVTVSVGAAEAAPDEGPSALLARADRALYAAKAGGRNRVELAA